MSYKDTIIWNKLRGMKYSFLLNKHYKRSLKMNSKEYENYLCKRYEEMMNRQKYTAGSKLNLDNPETFTEKCQWIKLYDQDPRKRILSDKFLVREYVKSKIGEEYLVPLISIDGKSRFSNAKEISFEKLPRSFVLKCNHGSHMNIVVEDKNFLSRRMIRKYVKQLNNWLKIKYTFYVSLETQYLNIDPCIIIESFLKPNKEILDVKFTFFNGQLQFYWVNEFVYDNSLRTSSTFLPNGNLAPFNFDLGRKKPVTRNIDFNKIKLMEKLATKLADNFTMVRVDFLLLKDRIFFSELTFNSAAGYDAPRPIEYNKTIGDKLIIDKAKRDRIKQFRKQR